MAESQVPFDELRIVKLDWTQYDDNNRSSLVGGVDSVLEVDLDTGQDQWKTD